MDLILKEKKHHNTLANSEKTYLQEGELDRGRLETIRIGKDKTAGIRLVAEETERGSQSVFQRQRTSWWIRCGDQGREESRSTSGEMLSSGTWHLTPQLPAMSSGFNHATMAYRALTKGPWNLPGQTSSTKPRSSEDILGSLLAYPPALASSHLSRGTSAQSPLRGYHAHPSHPLCTSLFLLYTGKQELLLEFTAQGVIP